MNESTLDHNHHDSHREVEPDGNPCILEEIQIEELAIDGICGVY